MGAQQPLQHGRHLPRPRHRRAPPAGHQRPRRGRPGPCHETGRAALHLRRRHQARHPGERRRHARPRGERPRTLEGRRPPPPRHRLRQLRPGRVRRRPAPGRPRGEQRGIRRPRRLLQAHLPHRGAQDPPDHDRPAAVRGSQRPGRHQPSDHLRRRQDSLHARRLAPGRPDPAQGPHPGRPGPARRHLDPRRRQARRHRRQRDLPRAAHHQAGRNGRSHPVGRARLAARRRRGPRTHRAGRPHRHQPRCRPAHPHQPPHPRPHPHRRVGRLRPRSVPARWSDRRQLRHPVHLRPGAHRRRPGHPRCPPPRLHPRLRHPPGRHRHPCFRARDRR